MMRNSENERRLVGRKFEQLGCCTTRSAHVAPRVALAAGEIAERGSLVDLGEKNMIFFSSRGHLQKHGCDSANVSRFTVQVGGKPRTVCVQARPQI